VSLGTNEVGTLVLTDLFPAVGEVFLDCLLDDGGEVPGLFFFGGGPNNMLIFPCLDFL